LNWLRNPFAAINVFSLKNCEQQLIDIYCDGSLKDMFDAYELPELSLLAKSDYPSLSDKATKVLLPFVTIFLCET
jgi:hypothetical protein